MAIADSTTGSGEEDPNMVLNWRLDPGQAVVRAPSAEPCQPSRFSDGSVGVLYAGLDEETAIAETVFHVSRQLRATAESSIELDMYAYLGTVLRPLEDVRGPAYALLQNPALESWPLCQVFAHKRRAAGAFGLVYDSARRRGGECIGVFRRDAVSVPVRRNRYRYCWDGTAIYRVMTISEVREYPPTYRALASA